MRRKLIYSQHADADLARLEGFIAESRRQAAGAIHKYPSPDSPQAKSGAHELGRLGVWVPE